MVLSLQSQRFLCQLAWPPHSALPPALFSKGSRWGNTVPSHQLGVPVQYEFHQWSFLSCLTWSVSDREDRRPSRPVCVTENSRRSGACPPLGNHRKFSCTRGSLDPSSPKQWDLTAPFLIGFPKLSAEQAFCCFLVFPWVFQNLEFLLWVCTSVWRSMCVHCTYTCVHVFKDQRCCSPFLGTGSLLGLELAS